ncbi:PREDICTED: uncharacterized protein LOC104807860 [Tarenaya hassleriana]|uniref:uncharacterized protein LOC104807860 n=1 Tax=Tarenaya hassleriana TaxID=28532 RepID=UPI00053C73D0|nr:PREDICTED: uncharacterized protein LOC104807860 [Tarenaya hassleriana]
MRVIGKLSKQEQKIRDELEAEIEKNLEEEIKDGIYNLAVKLHRLYQQRREREASDGSGGRPDGKTLSEVNISIKMEGHTKIEIKETKKEASMARATQLNIKNRENLNKFPGSGKKNKFHGTGKNMKEQMMNQQLKVRELRWKW